MLLVYIFKIESGVSRRAIVKSSLCINETSIDPVGSCRIDNLRLVADLVADVSPIDWHVAPKTYSQRVLRIRRINVTVDVMIALPANIGTSFVVC